jgi:N-methylhydantoinase A
MPTAISATEAAEIADRFDAIYAELFGPDAGYREGGAEITSLHVQYQGITAKPALRRIDPSTADGVEQGSRRVYWAETGGVVDTPVVRLSGGAVVPGELAGPTLVELPDTVVAIRPGVTGSFDEYGNLHVDTGLSGRS